MFATTLQGGMGATSLVGPLGGESNMTAGIASVITVTSQILDSSSAETEVKVWAKEAGVYGLPSKAGVKMSSETTTEALFGALLKFAEEQCEIAAQGLAGQMEQQMAGVKIGAMKISIKWTPTIHSISFEGDDVPRGSEIPVSQYLKDGADFQAHCVLKQDVGTQHQTHLGVMARSKPGDARCCSLQ